MNSVSTNATVVLRKDSEFNVANGNGLHQTFSGAFTNDGGVVSVGISYGSSSVTFNSPGGLAFGDGGSITQRVIDGTYDIRLLTDVSGSATASNKASMSTINTTNMVVYLDLTYGASGTRTFNIPDASGLAGGVSEMLVDMPLRTASGYPATLVKTGSGVLELNRVSGAFSGNAVVSNGTLMLSAYAPAASVAATVTASSATVTGLASTNGLVIGQLVASPVVGTGRYLKMINGSSQVTLTSTSSGSTNVLALLATGPLGTGDVTVAGGTLAGVGGVGGNVTVKSGGTLAPGVSSNTAAMFRIGGALTIESGGILSVDLPTGTNDSVAVAGNVNITDGTLVVNGPRPDAGQTVTLMTAANMTGSFSTVTDGFTARVVGNSLQLTRQTAGFVFSAY